MISSLQPRAGLPHQHLPHLRWTRFDTDLADSFTQGRSPFDAPLQDEQGEFILGPNVQHGTARNYVQRFDSRGHPENLASEAARRRLRRAQNEVLSTVGVVVRKAKMNRSAWEDMGDDQKHQLLLDENIAGANFGVVESVVLKLSTRWLSALRRRILVS